METPQYTLNPRCALRQIKTGKQTLAILGVSDAVEATEQDKPTIAQARLEISRGRKSIAMQILSLLAALWGGSKVIDHLHVTVIPPSNEHHISNAAETFRDSYEKAKTLRDSYEKDDRNRPLLLDIEPTWTIIMDEWIRRIEATGGAELQQLKGLFDFFINHGKPFIFFSGKDTPTHTSFGINDFNIAPLEWNLAGEENSRHEWHKKHNITYYDDKTRTLFLYDHKDDQAITKTDDETLFSNSAEIWFALHDAKSHLDTGQVLMEDPNIRIVVQSTIKVLQQSNALTVAGIVTYKDEHGEPQAVDTAVILGSSIAMAKRTAEKMYERDVKKLSREKKADIIAVITYRFMRLTIANPDAAYTAFKPGLRIILANPNLIDEAISKMDL